MKKNKITLLFVLALAVIFVIPAFGQTIVPFTTLSAAITSASSQANTFRLASTSGITAGNTMLYIDGEADFVNVVTSTTVTVTRGQPTSRVSTHANGALVWYGPPSYFQFATPVGYPSGSCVRATALLLPYIDINNSIISDCVGNVWVAGDNSPPGVTPFRMLSANSGGTAYTSLNTNGTATVAGTLNCAELDIPFNKLATGLGIMFGTTAGGSDKHLVALLDAAGNVIATSALAGATNSTASTYVNFAFTTKYFVVGPAQYFACTQSNGTSDTIRMLVTGTQDTYLTTSKTGTFGTIPTITVPTTFTTAVGPYAYLY